MGESSEYTVGQVAQLSHVSVRTLHHYDEIGLLTPSGRSAAGYRQYSEHDVRRLQQILFYRALEFGLDDIAKMLAEPTVTAEDHLRRQHRMLREQITHRHDLLAGIEKEMEARKMGISLTPEEQFEIFGTDKVGGEWAEEAEQRWGDTAAYRQSQGRTAAYTKDDWAAVKAESDAGLRAFADALRSGVPATSEAARALAEAHREFLNRRFYDCSYAMHRGLAEMYISDDRFRKTFDNVLPGLAHYVHQAIIANGDQKAEER